MGVLESDGEENFFWNHEDSLFRGSFLQIEELQSDTVSSTNEEIQEITPMQREHHNQLERGRRCELRKAHDELRDSVPSTEHSQASRELVLQQTHNWLVFLEEKEKEEEEYKKMVTQYHNKLMEFSKRMFALEGLPRDRFLQKASQIEREFGFENGDPMAYFKQLLNRRAPDPATYAQEFKALNPLTEQDFSEDYDDDDDAVEFEALMY